MAYYCDCGNISENQREGGPCATCGHQQRKAKTSAGKHAKRTPIRKVSVKRQNEARKYSRDKAKFIIGKTCPIFPNEPVTDIHHKKGREGYADQWAIDRGITLFLDQRFWLAVSRRGHDKIGAHPAWARQMGFSLSRTGIISL